MPKSGLLLIQLGSPRSASWNDVRSFLTQFLGDPRLVKPTPLGWKLLLATIISPLRAFRSAKQYRTILADGEMPLVAITSSFSRQVAEALFPEMEVRHAFQYGSTPTVDKAIQELAQSGCSKIRIVPLYPQFSEATSAAALDCVHNAAASLAIPLDLEVVPHFHLSAGLIQAWSRSVASTLQSSSSPVEALVFSFHGYPVARCDAGDPYRDHCRATANRLQEAIPALLGANVKMPPVMLSWQSRFGSDEWLLPTTSSVLKGLGAKGMKTVAVAAPSFVADNLETLYEIGHELREDFLSVAGEGAQLLRCPCPGDDPAWAASFSLDVAREAIALPIETIRTDWKTLYASV